MDKKRTSKRSLDVDALQNSLAETAKSQEMHEEDMAKFFGHDQTPENVHVLRVSEIRVNPRFDFRIDTLSDDLEESLKEDGQIQPIIVKSIPEDGEHKYEVVAGHRRLMALKKLNKISIRAFIRDFKNDEEALKVTFLENEIRKSLSSWERITACKRLKEEWSYDEEKIAQLMRKSPKTIYKYIQLSDIGPTLQKKLHEEKINVSLALEIKELESFLDVENGISSDLLDDMTVKEARELVKKFKGKKGAHKRIFSRCSFKTLKDNKGFHLVIRYNRSKHDVSVSMVKEKLREAVRTFENLTGEKVFEGKGHSQVEAREGAQVLKENGSDKQ